MSILKGSQHLFIPLEKIVSGTDDFQDCIGKGGYGMVYKGQLFISGKSTTVAVKRLNEQLGQGLKEFLTEIQMLTGQTHPNLITLIGYCDDRKEKIIVYEYVERGSLAEYIRHNTNTSTTLTWLVKLKICVDAARGLDHLHNHVGLHQTVIHRDIKSSNILIDKNWVAKISDFGLATISLTGLNRSTIVSHVCGTPGYCEPEYMITGTVKKESDVYSFGMVLFEVLCGRLCYIKDGFLLTASLAKEYYEKNKLDEIVDPSLKEQMSPGSKKIFSRIAYKCLHDDRGQRPSMDLVLKDLEESLHLQLSYSSESSYASKDPNKSIWELGAHVSKKSAIESSEPPVIMSSKEDQLSIVVVDRSSVDLPSSFEITTHTQPNDEIDVGVEASVGSLKEATEGSQSEMDQEVVKAIMISKKAIWKNQQSYKLVEEYFEHGQQILDFFAALEKCLKRVQEIRMLVLLAFRYFVERRHVKTLENLKYFKTVGDPFTEDFFKMFDSVYRQQNGLVEKLQTNNLMLDKKLKQIQTRRKVCNTIFVLATLMVTAAAILITFAWQAPIIMLPSTVIAIPLFFIGLRVNSGLKKHLNVMKVEKKVMNSLQVNDLLVITVDLNKVEKDIKDLINMTEDAIDGYADIVKHGSEIFEKMMKRLDFLAKNVERLETGADNYNRQIRRARNVVLQTIINPQPIE